MYTLESFFDSRPVKAGTWLRLEGSQNGEACWDANKELPECSWSLDG